MSTTKIDTCEKCGAECVLGVNAITEKGKIICDSCGQVKRGFAGRLLPEERKALKQTLKQDLTTASNTFTRELMSKALEDAS